MFSKVQNILDKELDLIKCNTQHGAIYKTNDKSVTVTLYSTTCTLNIQGRAVFTWTDIFVAKCETLNISDSSLILTQPRSSTPTTNLESLFNSTLEASYIQEDNCIITVSTTN